MGLFVAKGVLRDQFNVLEESDQTNDFPYDLPEFTTPKITQFPLPGGLHYYKSSMPDSYPFPVYETFSMTTRCVDPENVFVIKVSL